MVSELQPLAFVLFGVFFPRRKGFIQQPARAFRGWLGLCLCRASLVCANTRAFCSGIAAITDGDVEETESAGTGGGPGRVLEDLALASPYRSQGRQGVCVTGFGSVRNSPRLAPGKEAY